MALVQSSPKPSPSLCANSLSLTSFCHQIQSPAWRNRRCAGLQSVDVELADKRDVANRVFPVAALLFFSIQQKRGESASLMKPAPRLKDR